MNRVAAVQGLETVWNAVKKEKLAFMQVPPYPDPSQSGPPQQGQPQGPPPQGAPQGPPPDPSQMQQGAPQGPPPDPSQMQQGAQPQGPPPMNPEMAGIMDQVVKKVEELSHGQQQQNAELHQRLERLEQELAHERDKRGERQKIISALLPAT